MRLAKDVPKAKVVSYESPDFLLFTSPKKAIGIEVTRLIVNRHEVSVSGNHAEVIRSFYAALGAAVSKKSELIQLYNANPKLAEIWLLLVCERGVFEIVHRQLPDISGKLSHSFRRIDLLFPDAEKVFSL